MNIAKRLKITLLGMMIVAGVSAQQGSQVEGRITSEEGPIPGANVYIKGSTEGTITDLDGKYSLQVNPGDTITFSFIGYVTQEITWTDQTIIDVLLETSLTALDQVVVVGYGNVRKRDLTGAVSVVRGDQLESREVANLADVLQGQLAGVQVMSNGGAPGSESTILIRGISTINNNNPLYIVDGSPLSDIEFLNPKDIESVQVLKDASAAAIYGSRASNGVIIVKTKSAKSGHTAINFDVSIGQETVARKPDIADAFEYTRIANLAAQNSGRLPLYDDPDIFGAGTDWWDEVVQKGRTQNYNLSFSKGEEDFKIYSGINYFSQEGIIKGGGYERFNFKLNSEYNLTSKFTIGQNVTIANSTTTNGPGLVWDVQRVEPITDIFLPEYEREGLNEYSIYSPTYTDIGNPLGQLARSNSQTNYFRTVGNAYASWEILTGLTFRSQFNLYLSNWEDNWFSPDYYIEETDKRDINAVGRSHNNRLQYIWENYLTYEKSLGDHTIKVMAGTSAESRKHKTLSGQADAVPNNSEAMRYLSVTTAGWSADGFDEESTLLSYYGRLNYSFKNRYLVMGSLRRDGSSVFPEDNKFGLFPALSAAWVISEEGFMSNLTWINQLKIRGSWGQVGNQDIPAYARYTTMGLVYTTLGINQEPVVGVVPSELGNNDLKWETVEDLNMGIDLSLFSGKLDYSFDAFKRNSQDILLYNSNLPGYLGYAYSGQWANIGELEAKGYEMILTHRNSVGEFRYNIGFNLSSVRTKMKKLVEGQEYWDGNHQRLDMLTLTSVDGTAGTFYGYVSDGIFQNLTEINSHSDDQGNLLQPRAVPGDMRFKDVNDDGILDATDKAVIGNPEPDFTYGINLGASYKGLYISMLFTGVYGNEMLNAISPYTHNGQGYYNSVKGLLDKAWSGEGTSNSQPEIKQVDRNQNFRYSDYYIEDGSHLRLKNIQLGYRIPAKLLSHLKIKGSTIFVSAENLFTKTNFSGLDPDIGGSATLRGVDWGHYPQPRRMNIGLKMTL